MTVLLISYQTFYESQVVTSQLIVKQCCFVKEKFKLLTPIRRTYQKFKHNLYHIDVVDFCFHLMHPLRGYDVTSDDTKLFPYYISYTLSYKSSDFLQSRSILYVYHFQIRYVFVSCAHYVVMTSLVTTHSRFSKSIMTRHS